MVKQNYMNVWVSQLYVPFCLNESGTIDFILGVSRFQRLLTEVMFLCSTSLLFQLLDDFKVAREISIPFSCCIPRRIPCRKSADSLQERCSPCAVFGPWPLHSGCFAPGRPSQLEVPAFYFDPLVLPIKQHANQYFHHNVIRSSCTSWVTGSDVNKRPAIYYWDRVPNWRKGYSFEFSQCLSFYHLAVVDRIEWYGY